MRIFAHRGYRGLYPENTMLAYREAARSGTEAIELDCHLSCDGHVVLIHDETLDRTTDLSGPVATHSLAELREANAAAAFEGRHCPQPIPTLEEYCEWAATSGVTTNIEIKTDLVPYPGIEEKIWKIVSLHGLADRVLFSSFNHVSLLAMGALAPGVPLGALVWEEAGARAFIGDYCTRHGFSAWHPSVAMTTESAVADAHEAGIDVNVWTVNDFSTFRRMHELGVDGIFTDYPEAANSWKKRLAAP